MYLQESKGGFGVRQNEGLWEDDSPCMLLLLREKKVWKYLLFFQCNFCQCICQCAIFRYTKVSRIPAALSPQAIRKAFWYAPVLW